jgi:hypothetical protein
MPVCDICQTESHQVQLLAMAKKPWEHNPEDIYWKLCQVCEHLLKERFGCIQLPKSRLEWLKKSGLEVVEVGSREGDHRSLTKQRMDLCRTIIPVFGHI